MNTNQPTTPDPLSTPDPSGACQACGDLPAAWCPDCGACRSGCYGGHVDNPCTHPNITRL